MIYFSFISFILLINYIHSFDLPLAPYNVKVLCRQGRRFARGTQTATQCPSSSTACAYFQFTTKDEKIGADEIGIYDCVDNGIFADEDDEVTSSPPNVTIEIPLNRRTKKPRKESKPLYSVLCGAVPHCSTIHLDTLNPAFSKYLITHHNILLEKLTSRKVRFCCSLFHSTLQKLVQSGKEKLPSASAPPVHCQSEVCDEGAVGCLLHSRGSSDEDDEYIDEDEEEEEEDYAKKRRYKREEGRKRTRAVVYKNVLTELYDEDDDIDAVQLEFDYDEDDNVNTLPTTRITRPSLPVTPPISTTSRPLPTRPIHTSTWKTQFTTRKPMFIFTTKSPMMMRTAAFQRNVTEEAKKQVKLYTNKESKESVELDEYHCVYRHLNDEYYRYCLLVHQRKNGDRCYHHQGHTICCCFVHPDKETCDPTEMDLIRPPTEPRITTIRVTPPSLINIISSTTSSTSSTTTSTTTTTQITPITTSTSYINNTSRINTTTKTRCRVTYPRSGTKGRPTIVCDSSVKHFSFFSFILFFSYIYIKLY